MRKKYIYYVISFVMIFTIMFAIGINSMENIENVNFNGVVNTEKLNIRQGPGTDYNVIGTLYKNDNVNVIGKINEWYIVQTGENTIGVCNQKYIINMEESNMINEMLNLVNEQRKNEGVKTLILDNDLSVLAQKKANDMVQNNYFSHESPTLGTPFDMIKNNGIDYRTAGENIAGYVNIADTVKAWMSSEGHRANILSNGYNHTGIGIAKSEKYGYIYVQLFIGR